MTAPVSPYLAENFYADALSKGRHRDIVGGRWDETGRAQMSALLAEGLAPSHHLLDIGCGALRLGCKAVPYLDPGHYFGTDLSDALMRRGYQLELADKARLPPGNLTEDPDFSFAGVPPAITHAIAFAVFTHLPAENLQRALINLRSSFAHLQKVLFTVFIAPPDKGGIASYRQADGVVTHANRAPYHLAAATAMRIAGTAGYAVEMRDTMLPRGQVLFVATPTPAK